MKKLLALLLAVMMLASVLVACGSEGTEGGEEGAEIEKGATLKVWAADKAVDLTKQLCDEFIAANKDKDIKITVEVQGEDAAATQALNDIDAAADVFSFACDQINRLYKANALAPVFEPDEITKRNSEASVKAATMDGELYAFPETGDNGYYLVYDKTVVSDEQAKTLEGIFEACKAKNRKVVIDAGNGFFACMFPFTGGLTIEGLDKEGTQQFNKYDEAEVVATLKAFSDLFNKYKDIFMSAEATRINAGMKENPRTVGAGIDGSWNTTAVQDALGKDYGAAKLPTINVNGKDKQIISMHGYKLIGVNSHSKYPYAAQALADYLTNKDSQIARTKAVGWGPSNNDAAKDASVSDSIALTAIFEQSKYSVAQSGIADTFWTPMGNLGNYLWKNAPDEAKIKEELKKTIANVRDE